MKTPSKARSPIIKNDQALENPECLASAGVFRRLAAMLYDGLLILAMWIIIAGCATAINKGEAIAASNPLLPSVLFLSTVGFYLYFWRRGGQTLGMRAWKLRLISSRSKPLTGLQCTLRCVTAIGSLVGFLGYFWLWFDKERLTWHDRLSYTRVVVDEKPED